MWCNAVSINGGRCHELLGRFGDTPVAILRGNVGASMVRTRVMQAKLMLTKSIVDGENELMKKILSNIRDAGECRWNRLLERYLQDIGITFNNLVTMGKDELWKKIREYDNKE